jgi:hypothetical protein
MFLSREYLSLAPIVSSFSSVSLRQVKEQSPRSQLMRYVLAVSYSQALVALTLATVFDLCAKQSFFSVMLHVCV